MRASIPVLAVFFKPLVSTQVAARALLPISSRGSPASQTAASLQRSKTIATLQRRVGWVNASRAGSLAHGLAVDPSGTESQISQANIVRRTNEDAGVFHSVFRNLGTPTNTTVTTALDGRGGFGERCVRLIPVSAASRDQKAQNIRTDMALSASVYRVRGFC